MKLQSAEFMTHDGLCKFVNKYNIKPERIQQVVVDAHYRFIIFYWVEG